MPELVIKSLAGGLTDRLSDATKADDQLIKCDNLDLDKAMLGIVTPRTGTGMPYENAYLHAKNRKGSPIPDYHPTFLFKVKAASSLFKQYVYIAFAENYAHGILRNPENPGMSMEFISDDIPLNVRQVIEDIDKLYIISDGQPKTLMFNETTGFEVRDMGLRIDGSGIVITAEVHANGKTGNYYYLFIPTDENGIMFPSDACVNLTYFNPESDHAVKVTSLENIKLNFANRNFKFGNNVYVYRSRAQVGSSELKFPYRLHSVLEWDDTSWHTTWWDTVSDDDLTTNLEEDKGLPPEDLISGILWNNRMFGFTKDSNILRFSKEWAYEYWPIFNQIPIGDSDPIRAIVQRGSNLVIFKDGAIYEFGGTSQYNYDYRQVTSMHGTSNRESIQAIDENTVIFIDTHNRVWVYDGNFTEVSLPVRISGNYFKSAIMGRYYLLWSDNVWGVQGYVPITLGDIPGGDDPPPPPPPPYTPDNDAPRPDDYNDLQWHPGEGVINYGHRYFNIIAARPIDTPLVVLPTCYGFHIPSGKWTTFYDFKAAIVEQPCRGGESAILWFDGAEFMLWGDDRYADIKPVLDIQSKFFFASEYQEKRFRDLEVEVFNTSDVSFKNTLVGQIELYVDGNTDTPKYQHELKFTAGRPGQQRISFRFPTPILGKSVSIRFLGNSITEWFEIRDIRLHWEPRGTAIRE